MTRVVQCSDDEEALTHSPHTTACSNYLNSTWLSDTTCEPVIRLLYLVCICCLAYFNKYARKLNDTHRRVNKVSQTEDIIYNSDTIKRKEDIILDFK